MSRADVGGKWLLGGAPEEWTRWLLGNPAAEFEEFLSAEFQHVLRQSDALLRMRDTEGTFLLLVELQLHYDPEMPWRMQAYAALAEEKYRLPVYPLVFYLLPPAAGINIPEQYYNEHRGLKAQRDFRVLKAWELEARTVIENGLLALIPLTPLMKGADEETIRAGARLLRERNAPPEMEVLLALFASFVMSAERAQEIVRWEMTVLRESPWYKELVQEGRQEGRQEGLAEAVLHVVQLRFGISDGVLTRMETELQKIQDPAILRQVLTDATQAESLDEFRTLLEKRLTAPSE